MHIQSQNRDINRMGRDCIIEAGYGTIPYQVFDGKTYYLYKGERYFSKGCTRLHTEVWQFFNGKIPKGYHIHHIDGNQQNNDISNLECIEASKHLSQHMSSRDKEELRARMDYARKFANKWHGTEAGLDFHRKIAKMAWDKAEYKKYNCHQCGKEYTSRTAGITKYCHQNCKARALRARRKIS